jgi:hypothetical protein
MTELKRTKTTWRSEQRFVVSGPDGAVDFHFMPFENSHVGSVEYHMVAAPDYMDAAAPTHNKCWVLDGRPCWLDGTSLYASEVVIPLYLRGGEDALWPFLEREYRKLSQPEE